MNSTIEQLESRIAPASLVVANLDHGQLVLQGDDGGDNLIIAQIAPKLFRLTASGGTQVQLGAAGQPANFVDVAGVVTGIDATFGTGDDHLLIRDTLLAKHVKITLGDGSNSAEFTDISIGGDLAVSGGAGLDVLKFSGVSDRVAGHVDFNGNTGASGLSSTAHSLMLGSLTDHGSAGGQNSVTFSGGALAVKGDLIIDHTASTKSVVNFTCTNVNFGAKLNVDSGTAADVFNLIATRGSIRDAVSINSGGGGDGFNLAADTLMLYSNLSLVTGDVAGAASGTNGFSGHQLRILGDLTIQNGNGQYFNQIAVPVLDIGGSLHISQGDQATGTGITTIVSNEHVKIGRDVAITNGAGLFTNQISAGNLLQVGKGITITNGTHVAGTDNTTISSDFVTRIGGLVAVHGKDGGSSFKLSGVEQLTFGGLDFVDGANAADVVITGAKTRITGAVNLAFGDGSASVGINAQSRFDLAGDLQFGTTGTGSFSLTTGAGTIRGDANFDLGPSTFGTLALNVKTGVLRIGGDLTVRDDNAASSFTQLYGVSVGGDFHFTGTAGDDQLFIADSLFSHGTQIAMGDGTDSVVVENGSTTRFTAGTSFLGQTSIDLGAGDNDKLFVVGGATTDRVLFAHGAVFDGGSGVGDTLLVSAKTLFKAPGQPVVNGFE